MEKRFSFSIFHSQFYIFSSKLIYYTRTRNYPQKRAKSQPISGQRSPFVYQDWFFVYIRLVVFNNPQEQYYAGKTRAARLGDDG